jgi:hypothetical protein
VRRELAALVITWLAPAATAAAAVEIDMKRGTFFQKQLDNAVEAVKKNLVRETKVAGIDIRLDLGNQGSVLVKSAVLKADQLFPVKGRADLVFDLHFRHVVTPERVILGQKFPAVVAYDRHEDLVVEYDINAKQARARVLKGPFRMPLLPEKDYEVWINMDLRSMR